MKPFKFRLDKVLNYRGHMMKMAQRELYQARERVLSTERFIEGTEKRKKDAAKKCIESGVKGVEVARYLMQRNYIQRLSRDLESAHMSLEKGRQEVTEKRQHLKRASIRKKSLEVLRKAEFEDYNKSLETEEQKDLDELVLLRRGESP